MIRTAAILLGASLAACSPDRSAAPAPSASAPAAPTARPSRLSSIDPGMTEEQVSALLGKPDEVRTEDGRRPWIVGARAAWAYGVKAPGSFAFGGLVLFDADRKVQMVRSPIDPLGVRAKKLRWSDTAETADRNLSCHLEIASASAKGVDARVVLRNDGAAIFERRHGHTGIAFDLVVELYSPEKRLLARYDTLSLFSPHAPDDTAVMTIPPGGSIAEKVRLGSVWDELGPLPEGRYLIRVAFPFEVGRFSVSEPVAFEVKG